jgi:hypothetical protein
MENHLVVGSRFMQCASLSIICGDMDMFIGDLITLFCAFGFLFSFEEIHGKYSPGKSNHGAEA